MTELYLIRHGQTVYNVQKRVQGLADSALTPVGRADAQALGRGFAKAGIQFDAAYASDLVRAQDTAKLALAANGQSDLPVQADVGLREEDYASFEGRLQSERTTALKTLMPHPEAATLAQVADGVHQLDPAAETHQAVQQRFDHAIRQIMASASGRVMVVAHGTVILLWLEALGYPLYGQKTLHNASVTHAVYQTGQFAFDEFDASDYVAAGKRGQDISG
ncbi:histidine phosphatase family protein [Lacticaseibacillus baoqingensis]|uniref:Histidine phosphatase family protein n=1 Tax=Lacticaseibacillus baoqingensis TaxID=2486013 RepID=A0ABW4EBL7_9LACO|nr:histidine phosphatase family protein [Lacticaseibacillus baoqingensis]